MNVSSFSVNFRGSTGYGEDSIKSLPNKVGDQDVKDVQVYIFSLLIKAIEIAKYMFLALIALWIFSLRFSILIKNLTFSR